MAVKTQTIAPQKLAATKGRTFRSFLLMQQLAAKEIGERIQRARKERGITQEALAEMASFSKRSLQDYETGATIPYKHFREIGRLLLRPPEWFLYGDEAVTQPAAADPDVNHRLDQIEQLLKVLVDGRDQDAPGDQDQAEEPG